MAVLAGLFRGSQEPAQDSEKLLHLYWNRAELKKEFASLRSEQYRLRDLLKQQEGETARMQQKLEQLEGLLTDPEWAHNVLAYFQLRSLADRCERKVAKFAEQLKQQREQKQHNRILVAWNDERARESKAIEREMLEARNEVMELEDRLQHERSRLMSMSGFLKIFRRRSVTALLDELRGRIDAVQARESELADALEQVRRRRPPEQQGLDVATKRTINYMILSYAQQLFLNFGDEAFSAMVKEARDKSPGAIRYGNAADCAHLMQRIRKRVEGMEKANDVAAVLQKRAQLIGDQARFREEDDTVPIATSVTTIFDLQPDGSARTSTGNLLGENYWGLARYLSR